MCKWFVVNTTNPLERSSKRPRTLQFMSSAAQKSSFAETVATATLKIMSVRFWTGLACSPLGTRSILHFPTNNRSCRSSRCIVPCPTSHREERRQQEWWREGHLQILSQPAPSPRGAEHLTFNYDGRKQATGKPLTFILSGAVFFLFSLAGWVSSLCNYAQWQFTPWTGYFLNPTVQRGGSSLQPEAKCKERAASKFSSDSLILNL